MSELPSGELGSTRRSAHHPLDCKIIVTANWHVHAIILQM
uniref:Uncharacterized protein n=1 Tax=viral metagenome TaxID=1070528 RepID=A0A6C0BM98_9ZZZZ